MCMLAKDLPKSGIFCFNVFVKKKKSFHSQVYRKIHPLLV